MRKLLQHLGLMPTARDLALRELVNHSYASVRVVGRGTINLACRELPHVEENPLRVAAGAIQGWETRISVLSSRLR